MRRVALLLEMSESEAVQIIRAVSATPVRFGKRRLDDLIAAAMEAATNCVDSGSSMSHEVCSDWALAEGGSLFACAPRL